MSIVSDMSVIQMSVIQKCLLFRCQLFRWRLFRCQLFRCQLFRCQLFRWQLLISYFFIFRKACDQIWSHPTATWTALIAPTANREWVCTHTISTWPNSNNNNNLQLKEYPTMISVSPKLATMVQWRKRKFRETMLV